jgi:RNA polymerase sigma-70 factor (family 1)
VVKENQETDELLLGRISTGSEEAFTTLFHRYRNKIFAIAYDLTESESVAEEIVQDVFLKIWVKRTSLPEVKYFKAYLFTSARNHIINAIRKIRLQQQKELEAAGKGDSISDSVTNALLDKEYNIVFQRAVARLSTQQAQVYHLIKEKGYTRDKVAEMLNLSPDTVKTHLAQAMRNIRAFCIANMELTTIMPVFGLFLNFS